MTTQPQEIALRLIEGEAELETGDHRNDRTKLEAADELRSELAHELETIIAKEVETARKLEARRTRRAVLDQELHEARETFARLTHEQALASSNAVLIEAEESAGTQRVEAAQIVDQARQQAEAIVAEANRESGVIVDQGRERLHALEEDAVARATELDNRHRALTERLQVMETLYSELQETLKVVAETSIEDLDAGHDALRQLDETHPLPEPPSMTGPEIGVSSETNPSVDVDSRGF